MSIDFRPERSDAIRAALRSQMTRPRVLQRILGSIGLVALGLGVGTAVSAAAFSLNTPAPVSTATTGGGIAAPPGVLPGQPVISILSAPVTLTTTSSAELTLDPAPDGATHVRVSIGCLAVGTVSWGLDAGGNNPSVECRSRDLRYPSSAYMDFAIDSATTTLYIGAPEGVEATVTYQYLNYVETAWGVNANGDTYGVGKEGQGEPDLTAVMALTPGGDSVQAYAYWTEFSAFGPDWPSQPSTPEEALAWQAERDAKYPHGWDIPAYESDGVTQVGTFHVGNG